ncbi:MAG: hypothetical protein Q9218_003095 [Villophora microphyllina]
MKHFKYTTEKPVSKYTTFELSLRTMANLTVIQCSSLRSRTDFTSYIAAIRASTGDNLSRVTDCKVEICCALWGSGNPDVSGIGVSLYSSSLSMEVKLNPTKMISGYIVANVLGLVLALVLFLSPLASRISRNNQRRRRSTDRIIHVFSQGYSRFYDNAIFLSFSIQIASIVMLVRVDYGVNTHNMGDSTAKITRAASLLCLLPLLYVTLMPQLLHSPFILGEHPRQKPNTEESLRFGQFALCWLLSLYPFYSKMVDYFGPSLIGNGPHRVISDDNWSIISNMCTSNVTAVSPEEAFAMQILGVSGSLFVCICVLLKIIWLAMQKQHMDSWLVRWIRSYGLTAGPRLCIAIFVLLPAFAVGQIWTIFRLRRFQADIAKNAGNLDIDNEWSFGQVAGVTVFAPVLIECWFYWSTWNQEMKGC